MTTRGGVAKSLRHKKEQRPDDFCAVKNCLFRTRVNGEERPCMRHPVPESFDTAENEAAIQRLHASLSVDFPPRSAS